jgi:hypothetical protein
VIKTVTWLADVPSVDGAALPVNADRMGQLTKAYASAGWDRI